MNAPRLHSWSYTIVALGVGEIDIVVDFHAGDNSPQAVTAQVLSASLAEFVVFW